MKVTKRDLIDQLVENYHYTKSSAKELVDTFTDIVLENMEAGNTVSIHGFGSFDIITRKARTARDPLYHQLHEVPEHLVARFFPGNSMKRAVRTWEDNRNRGRG